MLQCKKGPKRVSHLFIFGVPVYLCVVKIVKCLVPTCFLAIVNKWHTIYCIGKHCKRIAIITILLSQCLLAFIVVLVVIRYVQHTSEGES